MTSSQREPWRALRDLEPALGSRRRVLGKIEAELDAAALRTPSSGRSVAVVLAVAAAVAALWLAVEPGRYDHDQVNAPLAAGDRETSDEASASANVEATNDTQHADGETSKAPSPELRLSRDDEMVVELADASVTVIGPAVVQVGSDELVLHRGRVSIDGLAVVRGATCDARVSGSADVEVTADGLQVSVFAGTAEVTPGVSSCTVTVVDLDPPPATEPAPAPVVEPEPYVVDQSVDPTVEPEPVPASPLRQQVEAFRNARALSGAAALAAWRAIVDTWPDGPLREEADAAIIDALVSLGRTAEARTSALAFVDRYPNSPRAHIYQALAEESP